MPLKKGGGRKAVGRNISEFHTGKTYARTKRKFGKARADKQAVAVGLRAAGLSRPSEKSMRDYARKRSAR